MQRAARLGSLWRAPGRPRRRRQTSPAPRRVGARARRPRARGARFRACGALRGALTRGRAARAWRQTRKGRRLWIRWRRGHMAGLAPSSQKWSPGIAGKETRVFIWHKTPCREVSLLCVLERMRCSPITLLHRSLRQALHNDYKYALADIGTAGSARELWTVE